MQLSLLYLQNIFTTLIFKIFLMFIIQLLRLKVPSLLFYFLIFLYIIIFNSESISVIKSIPLCNR